MNPTDGSSIILEELTPQSYTRAELEAAAGGVPLDALQQHVDSLVTVEPTLDEGVFLLRPGTSVGSIRVGGTRIDGRHVGGLRIDVRPRFGVDLVTLIRYAAGADAARHRSEITPDQTGLDELVGRVLAEELDLIRHRGLSRLYVRRAERLPVLRGRPDFLASFPWNAKGMTSVACRYHELSCDTLDNRLIVTALEAAMLLDLQPQTRRKLDAHRLAWSEIATRGPAAPSDFAAARERYTRQTSHYRLAHELAELIVSRRRPRDLRQDRTPVTAGLTVDMAVLFERAVTRLLRDLMTPRGYTVQAQASAATALLDGAGETYTRVRPDVVVRQENRPVAVIDAKYKDYWQADAAGFPVRRIGNDDLYQLFFYASRLGRQLSVAEVPAVIVAPAPDGFADTIAERFRTVRWKIETRQGHLRLVLLPIAAIVHELQQNRFDVTRCTLAASVLTNVMTLSTATVVLEGS